MCRKKSAMDPKVHPDNRKLKCTTNGKGKLKSVLLRKLII